jgi:hypothetical protein
MDFGILVNTLGITVKKEAGEVVETSRWRNVVKPQATKVFQKCPAALKWAQKWEPKTFFNFKHIELLKFWKKINIFWNGASLHVGRNAFLEILQSRVTGFMSAS